MKPLVVLILLAVVASFALPAEAGVAVATQATAVAVAPEVQIIQPTPVAVVPQYAVATQYVAAQTVTAKARVGLFARLRAKRQLARSLRQVAVPVAVSAQVATTQATCLGCEN